MAAPNMQALNIDLSHKLDDPVALYTDNQDYTSAERDLFINSASSFLFNGFYDNFKERIRYKDSEFKEPFQGLTDFIKLEKITIVSLVTPDEGDVSTVDGANGHGIPFATFANPPLEVINVAFDIDADGELEVISPVSTENIPLLLINAGSGGEFDGSTAENPRWLYGAISGVKHFRIIPKLSSAGTSIWISYLKQPVFTLTSGGVPDIDWNTLYHQDILELAFAYARLDNGEPQIFQMLAQSVAQKHQIKFASEFDNDSKRT